MNWSARLRRLLARFGPPPGPTGAPADGPAAWAFFETSGVVSLGILFATVAAIVLISYVGVSPIALPLQENQLASVRVVAADTFAYTSRIRTQQAREQASNRVPPVYRLELAPYEQFSAHIRELTTDLDHFEQQFLPVEPNARAEALKQHQRELDTLVELFNAKGPYHVVPEDVAVILNLGNAKLRFSAFENGLVTLRELYREGIFDESRGFTAPVAGEVSAYQVRGPNGEIVAGRLQSREDALTFLRINLAAEGVGREGAMALFRLFRNGLTPNLLFDSATTGRLRAHAAEGQRDVVVTVQKGDVLAEPNTRVTPQQHEMIVAHRTYLLGQDSIQVSGHLQLFGRMLLVLAMVLGAVFYIRLEDRASLQSNSRLGLLALVVILNLALVRAFFELGELPFFVQHPDVATALPYLAPTALAPLIVAVLLGAGPAIFMALVVALFTGVINGNRLDVVVVTFFASIIGVYACRKARQRSRVIRAGFLAGLCVAGFALLLGAADNLGTEARGVGVTLLRQMAAGLASGALTAMAVVGLLPVLEMLFRRTTDITLLELTDYNHPLLKLLQLEAPGTYHHSLMVANLAENAASAIGANPLVCRVCALFHDIGKTVKPEFFTENQRDRANPHDDCTPAVSALIIKGHVREGLELAQKHRLPRVVIDAIQQHHGTTLIQFFYQRARKEARAPLPGQPFAPEPSASDPVTEQHFRYAGPKPQTRESALIFFADCVEAASRSLRLVTPQHLSELIERLFKERIDDGQLDECAITFEEIARVKTSFEFTLLNMLHSRVAYPVGEAPVLPPPPVPVAPPPSPSHVRANSPASGQNL